jgi:broad specificity phosphatase PhoE
MYDAIESDLYNNGKNNSLHAENSYFANAVCLNEKGKVQAKAMGEHIKNISLPIGHVISSVSCRGRQTATLAFGGYDSIHRILVHSGPYYENKKDRVNNLKEFYLKLPVHHGTNTVVLSHNSVISCSMFINKCEPKLDLEEGGFYVISKTDEGLFLHHKFRNFGLFTQVFYKR